MTTLAQVIEWKWPEARTHLDLDQGVVLAWKHPTLPEPTRAELDLAMAEFEARSDDARKDEVLNIGGPDAVRAIMAALVNNGALTQDQIRAEAPTRTKASSR